MKSKNIFKIVVAILIGEIGLILLTTVAQEVLFDGISFTQSSNFVIIFGGLATFIAAICAGLLARFFIKRKVYAIPIAMSLLIITEMTFLISSDRTGDPLWFDILAALSLIIGVWIGFLILGIRKQNSTIPS